MKKYIYLLVTFILLVQPLLNQCLASSSTLSAAEERKNKILVLIIACDDEQDQPDAVFFGQKKNNNAYAKFQNVWRAYMHLDPEHIEAYFLKANPNLATDCEIHGDVIWTKTDENFIPGLTNKTLAALQLLQPRFAEFDYVLRTNLSSFYYFPRLLNYARTLPIEKCYCGIALNTCWHCQNYVSGAGILLSMDLANALVSWKDEMWNSPIIDDCCFGFYLSRITTNIISAPRIWVNSLASWNAMKELLPPFSFHFRIKHDDETLRDTEEVVIHKDLLKMFYKVSLDPS